MQEDLQLERKLNTELTAKFSDLKNRMEYMTGEFSNQRSRIDEILHDKASIESSVASLQADLQEARQLKIKAENSLLASQRELRQLEAVVSEKSSQVEGLVAHVFDLRKQFDAVAINTRPLPDPSLAQELQQAQSLLSQAEHENSRLRMELTSARATPVKADPRLQSELLELRSLIEQAVTSLSHANSANRTLERQNQLLTNQINRLELQVKENITTSSKTDHDSASKSESTTIALYTKQVQIDQLRAESSQLAQRLTETEEKLSKSHLELEGKIIQLIACQDRIKQLESVQKQLAIAHTEISTRASHNLSLESKIAELESRLEKTTMAKSEAVQAEVSANANLQRQLSEAIESRDSAMRSEQKALASATAAEAKFTDIKVLNDRLVKQNQEHAGRLSDINQTNAKLEKTLRERDEIIGQLTSENIRIGSKFQSLQQQLVERESNTTIAQVKMNEISNELEDLRSSSQALAESQKSLSALQQRFSEATASYEGKIRTLEVKVHSLTQANRQLSEQMQNQVFINGQLTARLQGHIQLENKLSSIHETTRTEVAQSSQNVQRLQQQLDELEAENSTLKERTESLKFQVTTSSEISEQLRLKIDLMQQDWDELAQDYNSVVQSLQDQETKNNNFHAQLSEMSFSQQAQHMEDYSRDEHIGNLKSLIAQHSDHIDDLNGELIQQHRTIDALIAEKNNFALSAQEEALRCSLLREQAETAQRSRAQLEETKVEHERQISEMITHERSLSGLVQSLSAENHRLNDQLQVALSSRNELLEKSTTAESTMARQSSTLQGLSATLHVEKERLVKELKLQAEVADRITSEKQSLEAQAATLSSDNEDFKKIISKLESETGILKHQLSAASISEVECQKLSNQLLACRQRIEDILAREKDQVWLKYHSIAIYLTDTAGG